MGLSPPPSDASRLDELRRMQRRATALLLCVSAAFVFLTLLDLYGGWVGYLSATLAASMVGGLADWFAVTAIFRHPLGLPIPHTAVIASRKNQFGQTLARFVQQNFLTGELVTDRIVASGVVGRMGRWMATPSHAAHVADRVTELLDGVARTQDPTRLADTAVRAIAAVPVAPLLHDVLQQLGEPTRQREVVDRCVEVIARLLHDNRDRFRAPATSHAPWWMPGAIQGRVYDRLVDQLESMFRDIRTNPDHEARTLVAQWLATTVTRLETDERLIQRVEAEKHRLLTTPEVRELVVGAVNQARSRLLSNTDAARSPLHGYLEMTVTDLGERLVADPAFHAEIEDKLSRAAGELVTRFAGEIELLVSGTIERWDPQQTATQLEVLIGRDLQFIRINGTIVGGIAGLVIHAFATNIG